MHHHLFLLWRQEGPQGFRGTYWVGGKRSLGAPPGDAEVEGFYPLMTVMGWVTPTAASGMRFVLKPKQVQALSNIKPPNPDRS